jgi:hypothetical protein
LDHHALARNVGEATNEARAAAFERSMGDVTEPWLDPAA